MNRPYVSVIMPFHNAADTLERAIASVLAQSFADWELVMVDDGSTDDSLAVAQLAHDARILCVRLRQNAGRGHARKVALEAARGTYITMLDADDWMYPWRLDKQLQFLERHSDVTLVSSSVAITDSQDHLVGVRSTGNGSVVGPYRGVGLPVIFATSMFRSSDLRGVNFDSRLRSVEDLDFLSRGLQGKYYVSLPEVLYVYSEAASVTATKAALIHKELRSYLRQYSRRHPVGTLRLVTESVIKEGLYRASSMFGLSSHVIGRRSTSPSEKDVATFLEAQRQVRNTVIEEFRCCGERSLSDKSA